MQSQLYKTSQNLSSNFPKPPPNFLNCILTFEEKYQKKQVPKIIKISNSIWFNEEEIENYLKTLNSNLYFIVDKCYKIIELIQSYSNFSQNDNLKELHYLLFSISEKSNKILNQNKINLF